MCCDVEIDKRVNFNVNWYNELLSHRSLIFAPPSADLAKTRHAVLLCQRDNRIHCTKYFCEKAIDSSVCIKRSIKTTSFAWLEWNYAKIDLRFFCTDHRTEPFDSIRPKHIHSNRSLFLPRFYLICQFFVTVFVKELSKLTSPMAWFQLFGKTSKFTAFQRWNGQFVYEEKCLRQLTLFLYYPAAAFHRYSFSSISEWIWRENVIISLAVRLLSVSAFRCWFHTSIPSTSHDILWWIIIFLLFFSLLWILLNRFNLTPVAVIVPCFKSQRLTNCLKTVFCVHLIRDFGHALLIAFSLHCRCCCFEHNRLQTVA